MTIAKLNKVTLIAQRTQKDKVLDALQTFGCLHLIPLTKKDAKVQKASGGIIDDSQEVLRFLSETRNQRRQITRQQNFNVQSFLQEVMALKSALRLANDKRLALVERIKLFEPWGDIFFPPHQDLQDYKLWFYVLPHNKVKHLDKVEHPWQIISKSNRFCYVVLISKTEPESTAMPVERSHLGSEPLSELRLLLEDVEVEIEDLNSKREQLTRYRYLFTLKLNVAENDAMLNYARSLTWDDDKTIMLQAWLQSDKLDELEQLAEELHCAFVVEEPLETEQPPTFIEQPDDLAASKDLALFYQVPDYRSWDPSRLLFFSFSLFFAMIIADAGYGVVLLFGLLLMRGKFEHMEKGKAYFYMALSLSLFTILYGVLVGSYFGLAPPQSSLFSSFNILDLQDFDSMMTLSIVIGVMHIGIANIMLMTTNTPLTFKLTRIGWLGLIVSGLFHWLYIDNATIAFLTVLTSALSVFLIFIFAGQQKLSTPMGWLLRFKDGLLSLTGIMTIFGDILSYMRLFALGLASASLAITFNQLALDVYESTPGIGLLASILILFVGHCLNLLLSLISGVVHGLRLNYIEFYKWGLPEEGKAFRRFSKKEIKHE